MIRIPPKPTELPVAPWHEATIMIFGIPGTGKTRFCNDGLDTFFISTLPLQKEFNMARVQPIKSWDEFKGLVEQICNDRQQGNLEISSVVIDVLDNLPAYCLDYICKQQNVSYPPRDDYGRTWAKISNEFRGVIDALLRVIPVRFITHVVRTELNVTHASGITEAIEVTRPSFKGGAKIQEYIDGVVQAVGYMAKNSDNQFTITFDGTHNIEAKDRTDMLRGYGQIALPPDANLGFQYIGKCYDSVASKKGLNIKSKYGG